MGEADPGAEGNDEMMSYLESLLLGVQKLQERTESQSQRSLVGGQSWAERGQLPEVVEGLCVRGGGLVQRSRLERTQNGGRRGYSAAMLSVMGP